MKISSHPFSRNLVTFFFNMFIIGLYKMRIQTRRFDYKCWSELTKRLSEDVNMIFSELI